jgi:hypothetical protein
VTNYEAYCWIVVCLIIAMASASAGHVWLTVAWGVLGIVWVWIVFTRGHRGT